MGRARWRRRAARRGDPRPDPVDDPRGDRRDRADARLVQVARCCAGRRRRRRSATSAPRSWGSSSRTATSTTTTARCGSWTPTGSLLADRIDPHGYRSYLGEAVEPWSYLKSTYWKVLGYPEGVYRVGPLARVIVADQMGTPRADIELDEFRAPARPRARAARSTTTTRGSSTRSTPPSGSRSCFASRTSCRLAFGPSPDQCNEGIGVSEAPRGTLIHHYRVDDDGIVEWANLVIATGPQQPRDEPERRPGREAIREERPADRADAQPGRGGHPVLSTRASRARPTRSARWLSICSSSARTERSSTS